MVKKAKLLWVDLEMTGLEPGVDKILEVAAIATDWDFKEIATYTRAVRVDTELFDERTEVGKDFWSKFPEVHKALRDQNDSEQARDSSVVEGELVEFLQNHFKPGDRVLLAGNSIHQDRRFMIAEWPTLDALLHYRMLDVSAWKVVFDGKYGKRFAKPEAHRALDDIRGSIDELKYYLGKVRV